MIKKIMSIIAVFGLALFLQIACKNDIQNEAPNKNEPVLVQKTEATITFETKNEIRNETKTVYDLAIFDEDPPEPEEVHPFLQMPVLLTLEEQDLLLRVAMAEAEGEDTIGQALVMRVVLNRCITLNKDVRTVIYQPKQFATNRMTLKPNEGVYEALSMVIDGWDESDGALYFCNKGYSKYGEPLFQHGGHYFSR